MATIMLSSLCSAKSVILLLLIFNEVLFVVVDSSSIKVHDNFKCSQQCVQSSVTSFPLTFSARSRLECAVHCSKQKWCSRYIFVKNQNGTGSNLQIGSSPCYLYKEVTPMCATATVYTSEAIVCGKIRNTSATLPQICSTNPLRVLDIRNGRVYSSVGYDSLENLLTFENNLKIQYSYGGSKFSVNANYFTLDTNLPEVRCASVLDQISGSTLLEKVIVSRYFCSNGSQAARYVNEAEQFFWDVQMPSSTLSNRKQVFGTGEDRTSLDASLSSGFDIKILLGVSNKITHADVIITNTMTDVTAAQVRLYENGQLTIITHPTVGATEDVTWAPGATVSNPSSYFLITKWFSDPIWNLVYKNTFFNPTSTWDNLKAAIEKGRRIRVKISLDEIVLLANPDCVAITDQGEIIANVLRVYNQKSAKLLDTILNTVLGGATTQPQWTHYMFTTSGEIAAFTTTIGASKYVESFGTATIQWYEEARNWTLVHVSGLANATTLAQLTDVVLKGNDIRVMVQVSDTKNWFSCNMVEVTANGQEVKCHVSGKLAIGGTASFLQTLLKFLFKKLTTNTIASDCFIVYAAGGTVGPSSSCLWNASLPTDSPTQPDRVEWFVAC